MSDGFQPKGVKTRLLGAGMLFVGGLNSMLAWRGGFDGGLFAAALMATGLALLFVGAVRGNRARDNQRRSET